MSKTSPPPFFTALKFTQLELEKRVGTSGPPIESAADGTILRGTITINFSRSIHKSRMAFVLGEGICSAR